MSDEQRRTTTNVVVRVRKRDADPKARTLTVAIRMTEDDYARFVRLATSADVPMSSLVRRALFDAIPRWEAAIAADRMALLAPGRNG